MIIKCKVCNGSGRFRETVIPFGTQDSPCPACKGAGQFEIAIPEDKLVTCQFCQGTGVSKPTNLFNLSALTTCPACKGVGLIERPVIGSSQTGVNEVSTPQTPRLPHYEYDVAISFAGEDREIVEQYSNTISSRGLRVFYDKYDQANLWGSNLYDKLDEVYRTKALFCVIFISEHYAAKVWTDHERKSAQARALRENREYILPVRLDDTEIPGIPSTVSYLDLREISVHKLAYMTIEKVNKLKSKT